MFTLIKSDSETSARRGRVHTPHGVLETPAFMPVGTQATVKAMTPHELREVGAQVILSNTYHLFIRPGLDVIEPIGGLHAFMRWDGPILTDSGGFQVFSLAKLRKLSEEGVDFQSHVDGAALRLTPESVMEIQRVLGSDVAMVLDECPPYPCTHEYAAKSLDLTLRWAARARQWVADNPPPRTIDGLAPQVFGIVQGATYSDLRHRAATELAAMDFDGYAIGGVSVGEPEAEMYLAAEAAAPHLPAHKARYCMGLGTPPQMLELIARGVDMFDCVLPTRIARNGTAFTDEGTLNLRNAKYTRDPRPITPDSFVADYSLAYIRHLLKAEEILGLRLVTLHNLHYYLRLMQRARDAIEAGCFAAFRDDFVARYRRHDAAAVEALSLSAAPLRQP